MNRTVYPLSLDLAGRRVVVVGGGPVAARRAAGLADAGAHVEVVAPYVCEDLRDDGRIVVLLRDYAPGDLAGAWLVHTATGEPAVDSAVATEAEAQGTWCVRADDAEASAAWTPAVLRRDDITVAVTTGRDPRRALRLRNALGAALDEGSLPLRHHRPGAGHVALVGGGPGDAGLITTRGRALLAAADVVVVDRLAPRELLDELDDDVEVIDAGKAPHAHTLTQSEIEDLLVERARRGLRVVRLKGGDPYVLGRGGEEALACVAAGVAVEVVPGVTSAVAVPALAGIPVTHRGLARGFTVASAHDADLDWAALSAVDGTLVLLMGVGRLAVAAAELVAHGRPASTPVAVVERGSTPQQRTTVATLADIAEVAVERGVASPAVVVVGEVVRLHHALAPEPANTRSASA
ncbi:MAG TPA: uroporphyrinogen-III C-methyltransferase [Candidatus Limnocylindria bacterium]|nr:uroporphyrinogen-III C-methyltransferase [Candidatus Limnocylindria bacterium]